MSRVRKYQLDSTGGYIYPDEWAHTLGYTNGALTTDTITDGTNTWVQTLTYSNGALATVSAWVKQ